MIIGELVIVQINTAVAVEQICESPVTGLARFAAVINNFAKIMKLMTVL